MAGARAKFRNVDGAPVGALFRLHPCDTSFTLDRMLAQELAGCLRDGRPVRPVPSR